MWHKIKISGSRWLHWHDSVDQTFVKAQGHSSTTMFCAEHDTVAKEWKIISFKKSSKVRQCKTHQQDFSNLDSVSQDWHSIALWEHNWDVAYSWHAQLIWKSCSIDTLLWCQWLFHQVFCHCLLAFCPLNNWMALQEASHCWDTRERHCGAFHQWLLRAKWMHQNASMPCTKDV